MTKRKWTIGICTATLLIILVIGWFGTDRDKAIIFPHEVEPTPIDSFIHISPYDSLFRKYADSIQWDWKLLAAIAYSESKFDTAAVSYSGACGIMQMIPETAISMGVPNGMIFNPEENIKAASYYLSLLEKNFRRIQDFDERLNFVLSSYNAGLGHILDAMALATKNNRNRHIWKNHVDSFLSLKDEEEFYSDSVCASGAYYSGEQTNMYVNKVLAQWNKYKIAQKHLDDSIQALTHHLHSSQ